jgi:hypothetical protein
VAEAEEADADAETQTQTRNGTRVVMRGALCACAHGCDGLIPCFEHDQPETLTATVFDARLTRKRARDRCRSAQRPSASQIPATQGQKGWERRTPTGAHERLLDPLPAVSSRAGRRRTRKPRVQQPAPRSIHRAGTSHASLHTASTCCTKTSLTRHHLPVARPLFALIASCQLHRHSLTHCRCAHHARKHPHHDSQTERKGTPRARPPCSPPSDGALQGEWIPIEGDWPVGPQEDVEVDKESIWIDGCFDFSHHGMRYVIPGEEV